MHCQKCGAKIKEGSKFCPNCGTKIEGPDRKKKSKIMIVSLLALLLALGGGATIVGGKFFLTEEKNVSGEEEEKIEEEIEKNTEKQVASEEETETETESSFNDARPFSCQRAWVQEEEGGIWTCIDPSGQEIFSLEEEQQPSTDFENGVAVVEDEFIIDVDGNIVSSADDGKYTSIKNGYYDNGYTFVEVYKNTLEESYTKTGIIGPDGEWWMEPRELSTVDSLDHGIYRFWNKGGSTNLYEWYDLYENRYISESDCLELLLQRSYSEDDLIFISKSNDGYNHFSGDADWSYNIKEDLGFSSDVTGFYNRERQLVIDLSNYQDAVAESEFQNGYCAMSLQNDQGEWFVTVINTSGDIMFEPISFHDNRWSYEGFSEGLLCYGMAGNAYDFTFIDSKGITVLKDISPYDGCEFDEEGLLRVGSLLEVNEISYIDTNGKIAF